MIMVGLDEKVYPVVKIATIVNSLGAEGIPPADALNRVHLSKSALSSPDTRVSLNQVIECYRNAARLTRNPRSAYQIGLQFHITSYGMYGFAALSSRNFRQTMHFVMKYHQLATPLVDISFKEEGNRAEWVITPLPHPRVDQRLYKFLVELQFGIHVSMLRDVMGSSFIPRELHVTYSPPDAAPSYASVFGCRVLLTQAENKLVFDATWLDRVPKFGNDITYSSLLKPCDEMLARMHSGLACKVRQLLSVNLMRPISFDATAKHLHMTARTLRRKLRMENTSFRNLIDELRMQVAIKYLRDTDLTIEDIAHALCFSDAGNFRHAFRRWTKGTPMQFRYLLRGQPAVRRTITA